MATQPTKDKIISSSWELLEELPLTEFSMRKLASRLGMTVSSLYYHFSSKEALFAELIDKASLEIISAGQMVRKIDMTNVFVVDYIEEYGNQAGTGTFSLKIKQKKEKVKEVAIEGGYAAQEA